MRLLRLSAAVLVLAVWSGGAWALQRPSPEPSAAPTPAPSVVTEADDIVVIARKLRRLRLHYASSGRALRWCHTDIPSGDPRLDRIGCALIRACVRDGFDDTASALVCVNRRIDMLYPVAEPPRGSDR